MDMEKRIKNHLINVYDNLTGDPSDFLIPMNILNDYITTEEFIQRYPQYNSEHVQNFQEHCQSIIQEYSLQSENLQIFSQVLFNNSFNFSQQFIKFFRSFSQTSLLT